MSAFRVLIYIFSITIIWRILKFLEIIYKKKKPVAIIGTDINSLKMKATINSGKGYYVKSIFSFKYLDVGSLIGGIRVKNVNKINLDHKEFHKVFINDKNFPKLETKTNIPNSLNKKLRIINTNSLDKDIDLENLDYSRVLGRTIQDNLLDLNTCFTNKTVVITGGAGSIGSELCLQILKKNPFKIIILDNNEYNLYLFSELIENTHPDYKEKVQLQIIDLCDHSQLKSALSSRIDFVFHAAAYKHVNLVENNIVSSFRNNVGSTLNLLEICTEKKVSNFVLISSDKAVRPSNFMGMTKRVCELLCDHYKTNKKLNVRIIRFGNVLGTSGSVVPKFLSQIKIGGPVTVSHEKVERYFLTRSEAIYLIIAALDLENKINSVAVLNMGLPIKIIDLAKSLINYCGFQSSYKNEENYIEIRFSGLKKGEKLYEELFHSNAKTNKKISILVDKCHHFKNNELVSIKNKCLEFLKSSKINENILLETIKKWCS